jgi:hypothetical protein
MKYKALAIVAIAVFLVAWMAPAASARNEFENGFKTELGAIAARSAVGLGVGVFNGIVAGPGAYYDGYYATPHVYRYDAYRPYYYPQRVVIIERPYHRPYYRHYGHVPPRAYYRHHGYGHHGW